ncbi:hypothetical protein KQI84_07260 [bacterium]|nr:hypothetical protein [bacterium]
MFAYRKCLTVLALLVLMVPFAVRAQSVAAPQYVPANFDAMISINDANGMWKSISAMPMREKVESILALPTIADDADFKQFKLDLQKAELELGFGLNPDDLLGKVLKGLDLYLIPGAEGAEPQVLLAARFNDAANAGKLNDYLVNKITAQMGGEAPEGAIQSKKIGTNHVTSIPMYKLNMAPVGDVLLMSTSVPTIEGALSGGGSLDKVAGFAKAYKEVQMSNSQVLIFGKGEKLMNLVTAYAPPEAQQALAELNMKAGDFSATMLFAPDRIEANSFAVVEDAAVQKLAATAKPGELKTLDFAGSDVLLGWSGNIFESDTVKAIINEQLAKAQKSNPNVPTLEMIDAQSQGMLGFTVSGDLLPAIGPNVGAFLNSFSVANMMAPDIDLALVGQINNDEKLNKVLTGLENVIVAQLSQQQMDPNAPAPKVVEEAYNGATIRALNATPPGSPVQMGLYSAKVDGYVVVSITEAGIRSAIDTKKGQKDGLNKSAKFNRASEYLPSAANQMSIVNLEGTGNTLQGIAPMLMGMMSMGQEEMQMSFAVIDLVKSLGTMYSSSSMVDGGQKGKMVFMVPQAAAQ